MENLVSIVKWAAIAWIVHDITGNTAKVLNTLFVERIRAQIEEAQARKVEAQALILVDRERRRETIRQKWDTV